MVEFYQEIRNIHIGAVIVSGSLFAARGLGLILSAHWPRAVWARYLSYSVDTILLTAALMLMTIVRQFPLAHSWLTVKVLLLAVYITLGIHAFRESQSRTGRIIYWLSALAIFGFIVSVARAHHPLGIFHFIKGAAL